MEFQHLGSSLGVYTRKATSMVLLVEIVIFKRLRQSRDSVRELFNRFVPFLAQPILFCTPAHSWLIDRPREKSG
jgi:hypothetical protein